MARKRGPWTWEFRFALAKVAVNCSFTTPTSQDFPHCDFRKFDGPPFDTQ